MFLPKAKDTNIVVQDVGNELLIYNLITHKAYTLNKTSKIVFNACDGNQTFDELKRKYKFTEDLIYFALDELRLNNLLADQNYVSPFAKMDRRKVIKKVGLATMFALPIITGLVAPTAANAASGGSGDTTTGVVGGACYNGGTCFPDYHCALQHNICCLGNQSSAVPTLIPGESITIDDFRSPERFRIGTQPAGLPCPAVCCLNGKTASGICTYKLLEDEIDDTDPTQYAYYYRYCDSCYC